MISTCSRGEPNSIIYNEKFEKLNLFHRGTETGCYKIPAYLLVVVSKDEINNCKVKIKYRRSNQMRFK